MSGVQLRRLESGEAGLHREVRLRALRDAPDSFADTFADAAERPTAYWEDLTRSVTDLGLPAISIPCGFTSTGLPVGLQIVGKRRGEVAVLRAAAAFVAAQPWAPHHPPVVRA